jgi:serine protease AprX
MRQSRVKGGERSNVLWGRGGGRVGATAAVLAATLTASVFAAGAAAGPPPPPPAPPAPSTSVVYVQPSLMSGITTNPHAVFDVIITGDGSKRSHKLAVDVAHWIADAAKQLTDSTQKAQHAVDDAQRKVDDAANKAAKAQQDAADAQATALSLSQAAATLPAGSKQAKDAQKKADDAAKKASDAAKKAQDAQDALAAAQQVLAAAQAALQSSQAADSQVQGQILNQDVQQQFSSISGIEAFLRGDQIQHLIDAGQHGGLTAIFANDAVVSTGYSNNQKWVSATKAPAFWGGHEANLAVPTIAIVDSGIDASRSDFGGRVLTQINLAHLTPNSPGDGYGHGTFVAGIAAGGAKDFSGVAPTANLVSLDVMNDQGEASVADVIHACDWILANKDKYNIRVANLSLHSVNPASVLFDPLDQAVEKLWLNGVVVVAASGNYGTPDAPSGVLYAPGNDPFVITVGAADLADGGGPRADGQDTVAPWSAWGYTPDGFMKPDIAAPGRYMIGPVSPGTGLAIERPASVVTKGYPGSELAAGYMELSGTSFAAPVVAGAAAELLALNPTWTPDQVKGALLVSATPEKKVQLGQLGVGDVNVDKAKHVKNPPNPNAGLDQYLATDASGTTMFNAPAWQAAAKASAAWSDAAWASAAWSDAAWSSAAWASAAWSDAAWASVAYGTAAWADAAWADAAWADAAWADNAAGDQSSVPATDVQSSLGDQLATLAEMGLCDGTLAGCADYVSTDTSASTTDTSTSTTDTSTSTTDTSTSLIDTSTSTTSP